MRGALARVPALMPGLCRGRARAKPFHAQLARRNAAPVGSQTSHHLAATAVLTSIAVPLIVPVIVAFLPAC